jgi:hypothetical protein
MKHSPLSSALSEFLPGRIFIFNFLSARFDFQSCALDVCEQGIFDAL